VFYNEPMTFSYDINIDDTARAKRRRQSLQSIDTKALGSNLGALARGTAVFDPNAYDGDGDGLVQDSTPFERPAVLSNIVALSRGFASATGKWGDTYEGWTVDKTNEEIAEVAVPSNPSDLLSYLAIHASTHGLPRMYPNVDELIWKTQTSLLGVDFSPETVANTRKVLVDTLNKNPQMRELIDKFGIPPVVARTNRPDVIGAMAQHMLMFLSKEAVDEHADSKMPEHLKIVMNDKFDTSRFVDRYGKAVENLLDLLPNFVANNKPQMESTFIHEYGHYLVSYASYNHPDPDVREMLYVINNSPWQWLSDIDNINRYDLPEEWYDLATLVTNGYNDIDPDDEYNIDDYVKPNGIVPPSKYAITSPSEMIAELFTESVIEPRSDGNPEIVQTITGTSTRGFASTTGTTTNNFLLETMSAERIAELAIPDTPEKAQEALLDWSKYNIDLLGIDDGDIDTAGKDAKERIQVELKRGLYFVGKYAAKTSKWEKSLKKARKHKGDVDPSDVFDFSEETVRNARISLARALSEQPMLLEHVRKFGMPPVFVAKRDNVNVGAHFVGSTGVMHMVLSKELTIDPDATSEGERARRGLVGTEWFLEVNGKWTPHSIFSHEYGHYLNYMCSIAHPDREARYLAGWYWQPTWNDVNPKGIKGWKYRKKWEKWRKENPTARTDRADTRYRQSAELERAISRKESLDWENGPPHVLSEYGQVSPSEMLAEGYSAYVSGDEERIKRVSPALASDIELLLGREADAPTASEIIVDMEQKSPRNRGFASLSITRDADGTRDMAKAFSGEDDSPLKGVDWLKNATPREIAQALVPRSREDLVNLSLQHMLMGNTNPDPLVLAAVKDYIETVVDHDLFDFSPDGIAMMEDWLEKALIESPQFLWTVRRFGSSPIIPTDRNAVEKYRDARRNGTFVEIPTTGTRRNRIRYPIPSQSTSTDDQMMSQTFGAVVDSEGILGFNYAGLFTVINLHHREWRGLFRRDKDMPKFGRTRRVSMGRPRQGDATPYPETDILGRDYISNFSTSLEGTLIHEYNHQFWSSLFGIKNSLGIAPKMRDRVARVAGLDRKDLEAISGDRMSRAAYLYPDLDINDALDRMNYARESTSQSSLSIIPQPQRVFQNFREIARLKSMQVYGVLGSTETNDIISRIDAYAQEIVDRGRDRIINNPELGEDWLKMAMALSGLDYDNDSEVDFYVWKFGWDPVEMENTWRGLAEDYPFVFGDSLMPFAGLAGLYAHTNPQETWAEMGALMAQPDADYRDEYITPEMTASYLYILGEHDNPFSPLGMVKPWEKPENRSGYVPRVQKVEKARDTVTKRASNALGNVASTQELSESRRVTISKGSEGHIYFSLGDYKFRIPSDDLMPDISEAYTEWASDSHYDMQHISGMMMGINTASDRPSFLAGRTGIATLLSDGNVSELDENTLTELRSSASRTKRMMDEVRDSETYSSLPLYQTMARLGDENELLKAEVGDTLHMPLSSFSPVITPPGMIDVRPGSGYEGENSVIVKLAIGASVFDSNLLENVNHDGEWRDIPIESITGGRFKVVSRTENNGIITVEIEHTDVFDADKGEFVAIDPSKSMGAVKDMVAIDREMREIEKLHNRRKLIDVSDPEHDTLTKEINNRTEKLIGTMFGDVPEPTMNLSRDTRNMLMREAETVRAIPISSMDKVNLPGFASTSREMGFDRIIKPERRVAKSAVRTLEQNREYIEDRMMSGRTREVLDGSWVDQTIERLNRGEMTHTDAMDIMNVLMDIVSDRIRRDPSVRDATDGDVYHYQKLGKRLRRQMLNGLSDEDLAEVRTEQGIQPRRGFASTSSNTRNDIVGRFNPTVRRGNPYGGEEWKEGQTDRNIPEVVVYEINGESVVFGVEDRHKLDVSDVKNIPLNPYDITGIERGTKEGEEMALNWAYAHVGSGASDGGDNDTNSTEISALLYAAVNGDEEARKEFERYAETGKQKVEQLKRGLIEEGQKEAKDLRASREFQERLKVLKSTLLYYRKKKDTPDSTYISEEEINDVEITTKDIVLVRWTEFAPEYDKDGNVVLGTPGEYVDMDRETVHFTLNHAVEEHMFWQQQGDGYLIMIPLSDVLEDNGVESIGNLYGVDTYFTPKPGQKLKLRGSSVLVQDVKADEDRKQIATTLLTERFGTLAVKGGPHYVDSAGFDDLITTIAADLGLPKGSLAANRGHAFFEAVNNSGVFNKDVDVRIDPIKNNTGVSMDELFLETLDINSLLRHTDRQHGKPTGVSIVKEKNPKAPKSFVSVSRTSKPERDLARDIKDPETADLVKRIQNNIGFASRSDSINPRGKTNEQIAEELELTENEKEVLSRLLPDYEEIKELLVNPAITQEQRQRIIDSVRVRIEDGVSFITTDPHPLVIDEIPDKRDWSTVLAPSPESQLKILNFLEKLGEKLEVTQTDNFPYRTTTESSPSIEETKLNIVGFSQWLMDKWRAIADKHPVPPGTESDGSGIYGGGYVPTGFTIYFKSLFDMNTTGILDFFGEDDFLNAHDLWGHAAIGRGFDRHGEWANMLAIFSMMDRWSEENDIPESAILRMKAKWFKDLEYSRFENRFNIYWLEVNDGNAIDKEFRMSSILEGVATDDELREFIALLDTGRVHDSANSKGFASATRDDKASVVANDIVRQSRRLVEMDLTDSGSETGADIAEKMNLTGQAARIAKEAFTRTLESISNGTFKKFKMAKGVDEHKSRLIDSVRIVISADDVPMIMADPHPVFFRLLTDRRDWSKIEIPSNETIFEFVKRLQEGNNPLARRAPNTRNDAATGYQKFDKWVFGKLLPLINGAERQEYGEETTDLDLDDELMVLSGNESWASLYIGSLFDGESAIGNSKIDSLDALHEAVGHVAIGRGFDRHGEYANALAVLSMLRQPELQELLTQGEIQQLARKIMTDYLTGPLGLVTRENSEVLREALGDEITDSMLKNMTPVAKLMQLITDYDGDVFELIDLLETEVDKTPALREDGSPLEPRPKGFASQSRSTLNNATRQDIARIVDTDLNRLGFASKASDFNKGTHDVETVNTIPDTDVAHANENGNTTQKRIPVGNEVVHPRWKRKIKLDTPEKSVDFVKHNGNLSEVPDEHLVQSILDNIDRVDGPDGSGWNFGFEGAGVPRFTFDGAGGGVHGMILITDRITGGQIGIKFEANPDWKHEDRLHPIGVNSDEASTVDSAKEAVANAFNEQLGFQPMPIRIVRRGPRGAGEYINPDEVRGPKVIRQGIAFVTELAQNRYRKIRGNGWGIYDNNNRQRDDVSPISALRMGILDIILDNGDRNNNNYLVSPQSDFSLVLVPIDHGNALYKENKDSLLKMLAERFSDRGDTEKLRQISKNELQRMVEEIMKDYRVDINIKHQAIRDEAQRILAQINSLMGGVEGKKWNNTDYAYLYRDIDAGVELAIERWEELADMSDLEIADELWRIFNDGKIKV
jgi:hypothetical protein